MEITCASDERVQLDQWQWDKGWISLEHSGGVIHRTWNQLGCQMNERGNLEGSRASALVSWVGGGITDEQAV